MKFETPSEAELLCLIATGDAEAFTIIYQRHQSRIYRFALLMSGSAAIAEDVTQEVFIALIQNAHRYDPLRGHLSAYLCGIARKMVLRHLEQNQGYVPLVEELEDGDKIPFIHLVAQDDPLGDYARNKIVTLVRQAVLALPPQYREVIVLCDLQEMSYAEAASALGCPVSTVGVRLYRGHALLREKLRARDNNHSVSLWLHMMRCFA